jgi:hypothetical protein
MSAFEFVFGLFGLLLGLCIAEIFGGLGRAFELRGKIKLGWLTPLLAVLVLADLASYWTALWIERDNIPMNPLVLAFGTLFAGVYYLAAYVIFPDAIKSGADLNDHYFRVRRLVVGISATAFFGVGALQLLATRTLLLRDFLITAAFFVPAYSVALIAKRKWLAGGAVGLLIALNLVGAITQTIF